MKKSLFHTLVLLTLAALTGLFVLTGCAQTAATPTVAPVTQSNGSAIAEGRVVPNDFAYLSFMSSGQVSEVLVKAGDQVKKGDVLARLGDREAAEAAVAAAELELTAAQRQADDLQKTAALGTQQAQADLLAAERALIQARQTLTALDTDDYQTRLDDAREEVTTAKDDLKDAQDEFDKVKDLDVDNTTRKNADKALSDAQRTYDEAIYKRDLIINELDQAKTAVDLAQARVDEARRISTAKVSGPDPDDQALADARLKNARAQLAAAQAALSRLDITAPYDCTVMKVDISAGEKAAQGLTVITVADLSQWVVETTDLAERDVVSLKIGQKASLNPDALPDLEMTGTIESIADTYIEKSGDITYVVRIPIENPDPLLRWGMTVKVNFK
ncbi:MAG TPA: efflux RND transporter periplasmic adaptor subunit [Anaerolineaceae bacterium]|nr:efflux RND transporter periplasmic adaptor subunit [Anaerolineaceae bacterium]HPN50941.1 efflux RND transporter periplasmic adaptor subunit [Anaerolineaceae bacterium]